MGPAAPQRLASERDHKSAVHNERRKRELHACLSGVHIMTKSTAATGVPEIEMYTGWGGRERSPQKSPFHAEGSPSSAASSTAAAAAAGSSASAAAAAAAAAPFLESARFVGLVLSPLLGG